MEASDEPAEERNSENEIKETERQTLPVIMASTYHIFRTGIAFNLTYLQFLNLSSSFLYN